MPSFRYGIRRAITEVVSGIVTSGILIAFVDSGLLDPFYTFLFNLLNMAGTASLILMMPFWGTTYLLGWMFGLVIMLDCGLVGILELMLYLIVPVSILILRILKSIESY